MPIFFLIILALYGSVNYYILKRALYGIAACPAAFRYAVIALFSIAPVSYILAKMALSKTSSVFYELFLWLGSFWFAVTLYAFLVCLAIDIYRLARFITIWASSGNVHLPVLPAANVFWAAAALVIGIVAYGYINANTVKAKHLSFDLRKNASTGRSLKVLFFSDAHFTAVNNGRTFDKIIKIQKEFKPDLILMGGDIVDDNPMQLYRAGFDRRLHELTAPLGKFTILGNHEYISGKNDAVKFLTDNGVRVLIDEVVCVDSALQIAGRNDNSRSSAGNPRKSPAELKLLCDPSKPVILLDHQPFRLQLAADAGFDLQLSGHTHHGQMFPFNYITELVYEKSWGYIKKGATHFYISSGVGTWGPPIKIGNDAEVLLLTINI